MLVLLLLPLFGPEAAAVEIAVTGIRLGEQDYGTRVVLDITGDVDHSIFTLPDPYRVVIDLPEIEWRLPGKTLSVGRGLVQRFRYGLF
ncbi:MAG: AMIN domain-containing protein, partial [Proteobacteria bacterium]|nr:AMIN domain-containing protein [Pseudomonadota bacterium]